MYWNSLADNNDVMGGSDKIWYWYIIYYVLMWICYCHWWWYIIFDYYCCYAPFITIVYWWYFTNTALFQVVTLDELICVDLIMIVKQSESWDHHVSTTSPSMWSDIICKQSVDEYLYYIHHNTLLTCVCILPMYYSESNKEYMLMIPRTILK